MAKIFINYRRKQNLKDAQLLQSQLQRQFGRKGVFLDVSGLDGGDRWLPKLERQVDSSSAMLVLIGRGWADACDDKGRRYLDNPNDFVRFEIGRAFAREIPVLPVLVDGASMPDVADLPPNLVALTLAQAMPLRAESAQDDAERIGRRLKVLIANERTRGVPLWAASIAGAALLVTGLTAGSWLSGQAGGDASGGNGGAAQLQSRLAVAERNAAASEAGRQAALGNARTLEAQLAAQKKSLDSALGERDAARKQVSAAAVKLKSLEALAGERDKAQREAAAAAGKLSEAESQLATAKAALATAQRERDRVALAAARTAAAERERPQQPPQASEVESHEADKQGASTRSAYPHTWRDIIASVRRADDAPTGQTASAGGPDAVPREASSKSSGDVGITQTQGSHLAKASAAEKRADVQAPATPPPIPPQPRNVFTLLETITVRGTTVPVVAFAHSGSELAIGHQDGVTIRDLAKKTDTQIKLPKPVSAIAIRNKDSIFVVLGNNQIQDLVSVAGAAVQGTWRTGRSFEAPDILTIALANSKAGTELISASRDDKIRRWDANTGKHLATVPVEGGVVSLAVSPDGTRYLVGGRDGRVTLREFYNEASSDYLLRTYRGYFRSVVSLAYAPDGRSFASAGDDGTIRIWSTFSTRLIRRISSGAGTVTHFAFAPDGTTLASASSDASQIKVWGQSFSRLLGALDGNPAKIRGLSFSRDGSRLASTGDDKTVRIWAIERPSNSKQ